MATPDNLMAFGVAHNLAQIQGAIPVITSVFGTSVGSAAQVGGNQYITVINASNSGSGLKMPQVGGDGVGKGALLGDQYWVTNLLGASIAIYIANNALGSAVTIYGNGVSIAGTTGFSLQLGQSVIMRPVTVSTWIKISSLVSA